MYCLLLFHCNNSYTNAPQCYVKCTLPVLFKMWNLKFSLQWLCRMLTYRTWHHVVDETYQHFWTFLKYAPNTRIIRVRCWSSLSSLGTNLAEMRLMFKLFAKMRWTFPYDSPTISQTSWVVCLRSARIVSRTFAMFSGVVFVDGRSERSSSSADFRPSLKRLYHKRFCFDHDIISEGFL
jgi:hypothetical protein